MTGEHRTADTARRNLDFAGFAQEFVRRNPAYRKDYEAISNNAARSRRRADEEVMARRWGVCFPVCAGRFVIERTGALAAVQLACDRHPRCCACRLC